MTAALTSSLAKRAALPFMPMSLRSRLGAALKDRIVLLAPTRRLRFALTIESLERFARGRKLCVLDAGCGDGLLAEALAKRNPGWKIVGADTRPDLLEQARRRTALGGITNVEFVRADLTADLGQSAYDAVAAIECLVEIPDDEQALRMMANALRPAGLFVVHVPERDWEPLLPGSEPTWRDEVRHGYLPERFSAQLTEAGLTVMRIEGTCRSLVRLAQELRDRTRNAPISLRTLVNPLLTLAVGLERRGVTWGADRALFALATRAPD